MSASSQSPAVSSLPRYLKKFAAEQRYDAYTAQDHAAWRYIMRQNRAFFGRHAVPIYLEGLAKTGIPLDRIPRIDEMDEHLSRFGWGAVPVIGFIPPSAFLEFQARAVLPIACDMRTVNHLAYTPAPDIVHEAAGHAPIVADPGYAKYLQRYARVAQKAIASRQDIQVYEAIRYLSDIKENPDTKPEEIRRADERLAAVSKAVTHVSEAAKVARMAWWTVEYGLVGDPKSPKIYGAGLLSSVGESQACLSYKVRKVPFSIECVEQSYDITEPQPQLFVARDMQHLSEVLDEFEATLAFRVGGSEGLAQGKQSEAVTTVVLDSGVAASGKLVDYDVRGGAPVFVKFSGPVQLSCDERQLPGHGRERHGEGFSSPLGRWVGTDRDPATLDDAALSKLGIRRGEASTLRFVSGYEVRGIPVDWYRENGKLVVITWRGCTVTRGSEKLFDPAWGEFDLTVGDKVVSVFGGPADLDAYGEYDAGKATTTPARQTPFTPLELKTFDAYRQLREFRRSATPPKEAELEALGRRLVGELKGDWLLKLEMLEVVQQRLGKVPATLPWAKDIAEALADLRKTSAEPTPGLIDKGLALLAVTD